MYNLHQCLFLCYGRSVHTDAPLLSPQLLQERCSNGQSLLSSVLTSRERVIPWGIPQIEDRALDTAQREWGVYQDHLKETQAHLNATLIRMRQMGQRFLSLAQWLEEMEKVATIRHHRRSDRHTKETQLKKLQVGGVCTVWHNKYVVILKRGKLNKTFTHKTHWILVFKINPAINLCPDIDLVFLFSQTVLLTNEHKLRQK